MKTLNQTPAITTVSIIFAMKPEAMVPDLPRNGTTRPLHRRAG
ncbi:hypothetical protein RHD99_13335 [Buttiauxella selenatireducens]|uniref:Uncharacterized protein n=1 Tax=Buttiauxella selenatireducens TaxID=3073902 RepID=A0ABY9S621_9ENTR|nr:hypothetical protein [Buttiauxella sp. R73]WMY72470.1 hypothetical protein RHD99_13335 [Buttiauxella sp. R73]